MPPVHRHLIEAVRLGVVAVIEIDPGARREGDEFPRAERVSDGEGGYRRGDPEREDERASEKSSGPAGRRRRFAGAGRTRRRSREIEMQQREREEEERGRIRGGGGAENEAAREELRHARPPRAGQRRDEEGVEKHDECSGQKHPLVENERRVECGDEPREERGRVRGEESPRREHDEAARGRSEERLHEPDHGEMRAERSIDQREKPRIHGGLHEGRRARVAAEGEGARPAIVRRGVELKIRGERIEALREIDVEQTDRERDRDDRPCGGGKRYTASCGIDRAHSRRV